MDELKPCPFCGMKNTLAKVHLASARLPWWWRIKCWNCGLSSETTLFLRRAIKAWNRSADNEAD